MQRVPKNVRRICSLRLRALGSSGREALASYGLGPNTLPTPEGVEGFPSSGLVRGRCRLGIPGFLQGRAKVGGRAV